jgi:hypothetical protein
MLLEISEALAGAVNLDPMDADFCRQYLAGIPQEALNPATLIDGRDVMQMGIPAGPAVRELLSTIRNEQLDETLITREQALQRLHELTFLSRETD